MGKTLLSNLLIVILAACAAISLLRGIENAARTKGSQDFLWDSSRALLLHVDPYVRNQGWLPIEKECGRIDMWATYPPSSLVVFIPFATFHWKSAKLAWLAVNLLLTFFILRTVRELWLKNISPPRFALFAFLVLASTPWRMLIGNGQNTIFSLAFFLLGFQQALAKKPLLAGALLSLSLFKYTITAPYLLWMAASGFGASIAWTVLFQFVLTVSASSWLNISTPKLIAEYVSSTKGAMFSGNTDIFAFCHSMSGRESHGAYIGAFIALSTGLLLKAWARKDRDFLLEFCLVSSWALLVAYHSFYDLFMLIFVLALLFREGLSSLPGWILGLVLADLWYLHRLIEQCGMANNIVFGIDLVFPEVLVVFLCLMLMRQQNGKSQLNRT